MRYSSLQYAQALRELVTKAALSARRNLVRGFVETLFRQNALSLVPEILHELSKGKKVEAVAQVAEPKASKKLKSRFPKRFALSVVKEPAILGGAVLRVGDIRVDNSVARRLRELRGALTN